MSGYVESIARRLGPWTLVGKKKWIAEVSCVVDLGLR